MRIASCLLLSAALTSGCATSRPGEVEAPQASLTGFLVGDARPGAAAGGSLGPDAEGYLARRSTPEGRTQVPSPGRRAGGFDRPLGRTDQATLSDLLQSRTALTTPSRLACVEAQRRRELVRSCLWGSPEVREEVAAWSVRSTSPGALRALRGALGPGSSAPSCGEDWPRASAPSPVFASVQAVPGLLLPSRGDLGEARYAAARIGADALLVTACTTRVYEFRNNWANLYPTLLGLLLPGEERIVISRVEGALVDVRTGGVVCVAQGESRLDEASAPLLGSSDDERREVELAEEDATALMALELSRELAGLQVAGRLRQRAGGRVR